MSESVSKGTPARKFKYTSNPNSHAFFTHASISLNFSPFLIIPSILSFPTSTPMAMVLKRFQPSFQNWIVKLIRARAGTAEEAIVHLPPQYLIAYLKKSIFICDEVIILKAELAVPFFIPKCHFVNNVCGTSQSHHLPDTSLTAQYMQLWGQPREEISDFSFI